MKKCNKTQDMNKKTFNHKKHLIIVDNVFLFVLKYTSLLCIEAILYQILSIGRNKEKQIKEFLLY